MQLSFRMIKTDVLKMVIDVDNVRSEKFCQRGGTQQPSKRERQSRREIKREGDAPHCSHHCSGVSPLHCDIQALPQVGE